MPTGRVKVFHPDRNFGFIQPAEGGRDVYVHETNIESDEPLRPGDVVEYELVEEPDDGPTAAVARVTERAPEDVPAGRIVAGGAPPTWDQLEEIDRERRADKRQRRRRR